MHTSPFPVYLALGSNLGDRNATLDAAVEMLAGLAETTLFRVAARIVTKPVGGPPGQGDFLNSACFLTTRLEPGELLRETQGIEYALGRRRNPGEERWGPRSIDIDILLYGDMLMNTDDLTIPHPRMAERRFVLEPLAEIAPEAIVPGTGMRVIDLLNRLEPK